MEISFDGLRQGIAEDFNNLVLELRLLGPELKKETDCEPLLLTLKSSLMALMNCYDDKEMPEDCNVLGEEIELLEL